MSTSVEIAIVAAVSLLIVMLWTFDVVQFARLVGA